MRCNASQLVLDLMPDHSVVLTLRCDTAYEAAVTYEEISEAAQKGELRIEFIVTNRRVEIDRTRKTG